MSNAMDTIRFVDIIQDATDLGVKVFDNLPVKMDASSLTMSENEVVELLYSLMYLKYATWEIAYDTEEAFLRALILQLNDLLPALLVRIKWHEMKFITALNPEQLLGMGYSSEDTDAISASLPPLVEFLTDGETDIDYNHAKSSQSFKRIVDYKDGFKSIKEGMMTPIGNGISNFLEEFADLFISVYTDRRTYE